MKSKAIILGLVLVGAITTAEAAPLATIPVFGADYNAQSTSQDYPSTFPKTPLTLDLAPGTYDLTSTFGITLSSGGDDTATFSLPAGTTAYMQTSINGTVDTALNIGSATETVTDGTQVFSFDPATTTFTTSGGETTFEVTTDFNLSAGDIASYTGNFQITAVPEPASVALGLMAIGAFAVLVIRSRRAQA